MTRLRGKHRHIAMVPQWDLSDLLADAAQAEPTERPLPIGAHELSLTGSREPKIKTN
jgi:hypothetical protein